MADQKDANTAAADPPASPPAAAAKDNNRNYGVFVEVSLDLSSAVAQKAAVDKLVELSHDGNLSVLARVGRSVAPDPKKALIGLGDQKELAGDYEVIAESQINKYKDVKTQRKLSISIG